MKAALCALAAALAAALAGCVNMYTRCPFTDAKIVETWQSTKAAAGMSYVIMFPQAMMPSGQNKLLLPENLVSVPVGCLCFADVACEAAADAVLWPADKLWLSKRGSKEGLEEREQVQEEKVEESE